MPEAKPLKKGDPCPNCGGELKPAPTMTAEQHAKAYDRENPQSMPSNYDTAHPDVRAELGDLYRCHSCGYAARFKGDQGRGRSATDPARGARPRDDQGDEAHDEPNGDQHDEPPEQPARAAGRQPARRT